MTNQQRDDLLINLSKGLNNLQESLNQFRVEHKKDIESVNSKITAVDLKLEKTAEDLRAEIKAVDSKLDKTAEDLRAEIKAVDSKLDRTAEDLKLEIKKAIDFNNTGIIEIVHDIWAHEKKIDKRLDNHDIEIRKLNSKLA